MASIRTLVAPEGGATYEPPPFIGSLACDSHPAWMTASSCATAGPSMRRCVSRQGAAWASPVAAASVFDAPDPDAEPGEDSYTLLTLMPPR
ncbi:hypothetical protein D9M68_734070 [compost metagenome]